MNLTGFRFAQRPTVSSIFRFGYFRDFSSQSNVLSLSGYLNAMPSVLVTGSETEERIKIQIGNPSLEMVSFRLLIWLLKITAFGSTSTFYGVVA